MPHTPPRPFTLIAVSNESSRQCWPLAVTEATDFHEAARNFAGEIVDGDPLMYGSDVAGLVGHGRAKIFEPGPVTVEVLADAVRLDPFADREYRDPTAAAARFRHLIDLKSLDLIITTVPVVPTAP